MLSRCSCCQRVCFVAFPRRLAAATTRQRSYCDGTPRMEAYSTCRLVDDTGSSWRGRAPGRAELSRRVIKEPYGVLHDARNEVVDASCPVGKRQNFLRTRVTAKTYTFSAGGSEGVGKGQAVYPWTVAIRMSKNWTDKSFTLAPSGHPSDSKIW